MSDQIQLYPYSKAWNITIWIAQALLFLLYIMAGSNKTFQSIEFLANMLPWVLDFPEFLVRFIGISELLGAIGVLLPSIVRIKPRLTVYAATGLACIQLFAIFFHLSQGEYGVILANIIFMLIAVLVIWGRAKKVPIFSKN